MKVPWVGVPDARPIHLDELHQDALQRYTLSDVLQLLRVSRQTIWRWRRTNGFPEPEYLVGQEKFMRWPAQRVREWVAANSTLVPIVEKMKPHGRRRRSREATAP